MAVAPREKGQETHRNQLTLTAPRVLLIDPWNGSGHEVSVPATVTKPSYRSRKRLGDQRRRPGLLDSSAGGYSCDEVAGVVKGAYKQWAPFSEWLIEGPEEP